MDEIFVKPLPRGRIAVYSTYRVSTLLEHWDERKRFCKMIERKLGLPPMGIERIVGGAGMVILHPLPPLPCLGGIPF